LSSPPLSGLAGGVQTQQTKKDRIMADTSLNLSGLKLSAEEREQVADAAGDLIAVHVYRELQKANAAAIVAAGDSGCNIIGNCSSSSKSALVERRIG
jgi:hypothetical protein